MTRAATLLTALGISADGPPDLAFRLDLNDQEITILILWLLGVLASGSAGEAVTQHFDALGASDSAVIPEGAKSWGFTVFTGTGTIGGQTLPAGAEINSSQTTAAAITVTTAAASTGFVTWAT